jgi:hypothetical protein
VNFLVNMAKLHDRTYLYAALDNIKSPSMTHFPYSKCYI